MSDHANNFTGPSGFEVERSGQSQFHVILGWPAIIDFAEKDICHVCCHFEIGVKQI